MTHLTCSPVQKCFKPYSEAIFLSFRRLQGLVEVSGFYLENDPCMVCNNPEIPFAVIILFLFYPGAFFPSEILNYCITSVISNFHGW